MGFVGTGKETYVYLNDIRPQEEVALAGGVVLLPASCSPTPDYIISKSKTEIDIGVACVFLRSVSACLHIRAESPQALAAAAWNSQWDTVLLSALHDCEMGHTFQSDVRPEDFADAREFHVTNYAFKGLSAGKIKKMSPSQHRWIAAHYSAAKALMDEESYCDAIHSLSSYRWHSMPRAQLALVWCVVWDRGTVRCRPRAIVPSQPLYRAVPGAP